MVEVTGIATGEVTITTKAVMGWTVAMAHMEVKIMEAAAEEMADMIVAQVAITITAAEVVVAAVEVTVNITVNNIKVIEVINIKLINDNEKICANGPPIIMKDISIDNF